MRLILLEIIRMTIVNHRSLGRCVLDRGWRIGVFDRVDHGVEEMGPDHDAAGPNLGHGLLGRILSFYLLSLGFLRFRPVAHKDAIAQPFLLRPFQGSEKHSTDDASVSP